MGTARQFAFGAFMATLALVPVSTARATEITGTVTIAGKLAGDAVISIENVTQPVSSDRAGHEIDHHDLRFDPHVLVVRAGASVRFRNSDGMPCRIYSISPAGPFLLRDSRKPASITFDRPGVIEVRCADHDRLLAYIVVKQTPFFAVSDASGRYAISRVPPGHYTLQVWYEGAVVQRMPVEIGTETVTIDIKVPQPQLKGTGPAPDPVPPSPASSGMVDDFRRFSWRP